MKALLNGSLTVDDARKPLRLLLDDLERTELSLLKKSIRLKENVFGARPGQKVRKHSDRIMAERESKYEMIKKAFKKAAKREGKKIEKEEI